MKELNINNVSFRYPETTSEYVINNFSYSVSECEFISIIGRSGCGKSTLLKLIAGLYKPDKGSIVWNKKKISKPEPNRILMFQNPCLLPWLTVQENILFGSKLRGERAEDKAHNLMNTMELTKQKHQFPVNLSTGMAQRTALARSLLSKPDILLLDESFSSLDILSQKKLVRFILHHWRNHRLTIILITHDIEEALNLSTRIMIMTTKPGNVYKDIKIDLPYPREPRCDDFIQYKTQISKLLLDHEA